MRLTRTSCTSKTPPTSAASIRLRGDAYLKDSKSHSSSERFAYSQAATSRQVLAKLFHLDVSGRIAVCIRKQFTVQEGKSCSRSDDALKFVSTFIPTIALYLWKFRGYADRGGICVGSDAIACNSSLRSTNRQDSSILEPAPSPTVPRLFEIIRPSVNINGRSCECRLESRNLGSSKQRDRTHQAGTRSHPNPANLDTNKFLKFYLPAHEVWVEIAFLAFARKIGD